MGDTGQEVVLVDGPRHQHVDGHTAVVFEFTSLKPRCNLDTMPEVKRLSSPNQMPVDLLESCRGRSVGSTSARHSGITKNGTDYDDTVPTVVPNAVPSTAAEPELDRRGGHHPLDRDSAHGPSPLTVDSLRMAGVELVSDIRLIDDTDDTTELPADTSPIEIPAGDRTVADGHLAAADSSNDTRPSDATTEDPDPSPSAPRTVTDDRPCASKSPLKSALKKGTNRQNKGLKVSFHDTHVFFIDTDAEVSAEPQLLTVRTFDLPLALSDIRVFTPTFDFIPSLPPGSYGAGRHYTYEDAIVSFDDCDDVLVCRNVAAPPSSSGVGIDVDIPKDLLGPSSADVLDGVSGGTDCPLLTALQQESIAESHVDDVEALAAGSSSEVPRPEDPSVAVEHSIQSLTEANLKQHEIMMANDILVLSEERERNVDDDEPSAIASSAPPQGVSGAPSSSSGGCSLSPPLKELTVDIRTAPGAEGSGDDWQVELSPLNSIPESETESSNSSQDTIIMMTSEESRRNEEHIQHSTEMHRMMTGCGDEDCHSDTASQCSQDSDETLKQVDDLVPPTSRAPYRQQNRNHHQQAYGSEEMLTSSLSQRTSDQIRQVLERNAMRRNLLRCSNIKRKHVDGVPMEKQRQWRSHESLLDTIKKLTVDVEEEEDDYDDDDDDAGNRPFTNGLVCARNGDSRGGVLGECRQGTTTPGDSSLSSREDSRGPRIGKISQELGDLIASPSGIQSRLLQARRRQQLPPPHVGGPSSELTSNGHPSNVPRDVRQWKIRSNLWNSLDSIAIGDKSTGDAEATITNGFGGHGEPPAAIPPPPSCTNGHHSGDVAIDDDLSDELLVFVNQDSERMERIRKRYSYTDGDDYETVGSFARRPSVRGIKPRFGSTTEILKQLQNQLQPPPFTVSSNYMTWPYPRTSVEPSTLDHRPRAANGSLPPNCNRYYQVASSSRGPPSSLPVVEEEIYGTTRPPPPPPQKHQQPPRMASYGNHNEYQPVYRTRKGREGGNYAYVPSLSTGANQGPPPYQPPPPPYQRPPLPPPLVSPPARIVQLKDERGAPEGASSSPKVLFDSSTRWSAGNGGIQPLHRHGPPPPRNKGGELNPPSESKAASCVYYVMQV